MSEAPLSTRSAAASPVLATEKGGCLSHTSYKPPHQIIPWIGNKSFGVRRLRRVHLAMAQKEFKMAWLTVNWLMEAAKALEQPGDPDKSRERRSQELLASMVGISRGTLNAQIAMFTEPDGRWDEDRRRRHSKKMKDRARAQGKQVHDDRQMRERKRLGVFLNKEERYGCSLRYSLRMPPELKPGRDKRVVCLVCEEIRDRLEQGDSPELLAERFDISVAEVEARATDCQHYRCRDAQLFARAYGVDIFDPTAEVNGDQPIPLYLFAPHHPDANPCLCALGQLKLGFQEVCPHCAGKGYMIGLKWNSEESKWETSFLDDGPRILAIMLLMKGIRKWALQIRQKDLAKLMGIDPNTFYAWRRKLEWLGYLKVVDGEIFRRCTSCGEEYVQTRDHGRRDDGAVCRCGGRGPVERTKPDKLIWLPDLVLDPEMAARERDRFNSLGAAIARKDEKAAVKALEVHRRVLDAWTGNQHSLQTFWNECAKQSLKEGIPRAVIDFLYPQRE